MKKLSFVQLALRVFVFGGFASALLILGFEKLGHTSESEVMAVPTNRGHPWNMYVPVDINSGLAASLNVQAEQIGGWPPSDGKISEITSSSDWILYRFNSTSYAYKCKYNQETGDCIRTYEGLDTRDIVLHCAVYLLKPNEVMSDEDYHFTSDRTDGQILIGKAWKLTGNDGNMVQLARAMSNDLQTNYGCIASYREPDGYGMFGQ